MLDLHVDPSIFILGFGVLSPGQSKQRESWRMGREGGEKKRERESGGLEREERRSREGEGRGGRRWKRRRRNGKKEKRRWHWEGSREEGSEFGLGVRWVGVATAKRIEDLGNF